MPKMTVFSTGNKALNRKLKKLSGGGKEVGKKVKKAILDSQKKGLKPVLQESKNNVPVKSGLLKKTLKIKNIKRTRSAIGKRVTTGGTKGEAFYGYFSEYGTKQRYHKKSGKSVGSIYQKKFMWNAVKLKKNQVIRIYRDELGRKITEIAKRG